VRARVWPGATIEHSLIMGCDQYQSPNDKGPRVGIGAGAAVRRAIIDKDASIGAGAQLINAENLKTYDDPNGQFFVRDGIIIVIKGGVIPDGFKF